MVVAVGSWFLVLGSNNEIIFKILTQGLKSAFHSLELVCDGCIVATNLVKQFLLLLILVLKTQDTFSSIVGVKGRSKASILRIVILA